MQPAPLQTTDTSLVNEAREKSERIIDILFKPLSGLQRKPRTCRQKARRLFVSYSKNRKHSGQQRRNLQTIAKLAGQVPLSLLDRHQYRNLPVIHGIYRQQRWMYENRAI